MSSPPAAVLKSGLYRISGERVICAPRALPARPSGLAAETAGEPGEGDDGQASAAEQAAAILARAEQRAAEILAQAGKDAAAAAVKAAEEARASALVSLEEQVSAKLAAAEKAAEEIVASAQAERSVILASAQRELLVLALEVARRIVAQELRVSPDVVLAVAGEALKHLPHGADTAQLRVHPQDKELVEEHRQRLLSKAAGLSELSVKADSSVSPGGCVAVTPLGEIDARIEERTQRLGAALVGAREEEQEL